MHRPLHHGLGALVPVARVACTLVRGALVRWQQYPFLDVDKVG